MINYRAVRPRTARYLPVRQLTGTQTGRYRAKKRKRRKKYLAAVLVRLPSPPGGRPRAVAALTTRGSLARRRHPRSPRATIIPVRGDETSPRAGRETEATSSQTCKSSGRYSCFMDRSMARLRRWFLASTTSRGSRARASYMSRSYIGSYRSS
ncbi:hypothetical protein GW17_00057127 [Ensete ventricosum]|nr:hypothetical protein GW17_00057127 [Ensete ventricosum]